VRNIFLLKLCFPCFWAALVDVWTLPFIVGGGSKLLFFGGVPVFITPFGANK